MHEILITAIVNMSGTFAFCVVTLIVAPTVIIITLRLNRSTEIDRAAREDVRSRELNQINSALRELRQSEERRVTYLEGRLAQKEKDL